MARRNCFVAIAGLVGLFGCANGEDDGATPSGKGGGAMSLGGKGGSGATGAGGLVIDSGWTSGGSTSFAGGSGGYATGASGGAATGGSGGSQAGGGGGAGAGGAGGSDAGACVPNTCALQNKDCGSMPDFCGGTLDCGSCTAPDTCGGDGVANVCGCSSTTCPTIYQNSFEGADNYPTGWLVWANCAADAQCIDDKSCGAWRAQYGSFCNGGVYSLRMHTVDFVSGCSAAGLFAMSPPVAASAGRVYRVETVSRNSAAVGETMILFFDASGKQIAGSAKAVTWTPDAWQCGPDPILKATSPAGTASLRIRLDLRSPKSYADLDLLKVSIEPP